MADTIYKAGAVTVDTDTGQISAPAEYLESADWTSLRTGLEDGTCASFQAALAFGVTEPTGQIVASLINANYQGWRGSRELARRI